MASPYVGEIRMFGGTYAPAAWAFCDGSVLPIESYIELFSLIGTTYGGDGETTFALPDLRGRAPLHYGPGFALGQSAGAETVLLTPAETPQHNHAFLASLDPGATKNPAGNVLAEVVAGRAYVAGPPTTALAPPSITNFGGSQPHNNVQPYLCIAFIISLFGIFPSS